MKSWLQEILRGLVTNPNGLTIEEKVDEMGVLFTIRTTSKKDVGILIGRKGEHVNAIRVLLRSHGHLNNVKASLKIVDDI